MKFGTIINGRQAVQSFAEKRFSNYKKAREIASLQITVNAECDFYVHEERKIIDAYAEKDVNGMPVFVDGTHIRLKDAESAKEFEKEIERLKDAETDAITPVTICEEDFRSPDDFPTPAEMATLEPFIIFE